MKFNKIQQAKEYKKELIKAKIINTEGSVPRKTGDYMLISNKDIYGTIGGGQLEYIVINKSKKLLELKIKKTEILNIPLGPGIGQCCGGYVQVELSYHANGKKILENDIKDNNLFIFGAGHIGQALSLKSLDLSFKVHIVDSRKDILLMNKYNEVDYIFANEPWKLIKNLPNNSYYIILTHSHDYDFKIINEILIYNSFNFIGLIGSKTKKRFANRLINNKHKKELIDLVECPVGLNINHRKEPNEIAVSIIAKLIDYKNNLKQVNLNIKINSNEK